MGGSAARTRPHFPNLRRYILQLLYLMRGSWARDRTAAYWPLASSCGCPSAVPPKAKGIEPQPEQRDGGRAQLLRPGSQFAPGTRRALHRGFFDLLSREDRKALAMCVPGPNAAAKSRV